MILAKYIGIFLLIIAPTLSFAQELLTTALNDSAEYASTVNLDELVITGQYEPQSLENSVYRVKVISKERIQSQGAVSLNEVLANELNIRLSQDLAIGNSSLSLQGISGNNVKVLLDGMPIVGRNGNGNDVDLCQVNLDQVERIEVVEGPMAVNYGANALAGVINIVTTKNNKYRTSLTASLQEESAGSEYGIDRGKHVQNLSFRHNFSEKWYAQLNANRNDFSGFQGNNEGRQREWNPKEQWIVGGLARYRLGDHEFYYKADYLHENIVSPGQTRYDISASGERTPFAFDEEYLTHWLSQHLQSDGKWGKARYSFAVSYSDFKRLKSRYSKNLSSGSETLTSAEGDQDTSRFDAWVFRGSVIKALGSRLSFQAGYDINLESASGGRIAEGDQAISDVGFYLTSEWLPFPWMKVRPGIRYALNSVYETPVLPSVNVKFDINSATYLRLAYGRGYRAPSIRELYFEFVDSNHRIFGNENLEPEYSHHWDGTLSRNFAVANGAFTTSIGGFYNDIDNLITISQSAADPTAASYVNVLRHKTVGMVWEQSATWKRLSAKAGFSYTGRYNRLAENDSLSLKNFFYSPEINANLSYAFPKIDLQVSVFYKYNGKLKSYRDSDDGEGVETGELDSYHLLDFTASKKIIRGLDLQAGVKNALDVVRINTTAAGGGAHSGGSSVPISYGRSYFLKLIYNLNID